TDDAKLLEAVGILQNEGLLLQELGYMVSRQQQRGLQDELFAEALQRLTARAEKAAAALGLHFEGWARVGLNGGVAPRSMMVKAMRADGPLRQGDWATIKGTRKDLTCLPLPCRPMKPTAWPRCAVSAFSIPKAIRVTTAWSSSPRASSGRRWRRSR